MDLLKELRYRVEEAKGNATETLDYETARGLLAKLETVYGQLEAVYDRLLEDYMTECVRLLRIKAPEIPEPKKVAQPRTRAPRGKGPRYPIYHKLVEVGEPVSIRFLAEALGLSYDKVQITIYNNRGTLFRRAGKGLWEPIPLEETQCEESGLSKETEQKLSGSIPIPITN